MCGIYGIWNRDGRPVDVAALRRATTMLRHRGPDDEGYLLVDTRAGRAVPCVGPDSMPGTGLPRIESFQGQHFDLAFGHRRLAIIDRSVAGHQPMVSPGGRYWLIYNGEIYNYKDIRSELRCVGHDFRSDTDTEVVLAAYQEWGAECVTRFNGMWALAILDLTERKVLCSRDRFGIKPFHYAEIGDRLVFASEIKALTGCDGVAIVPEAGAVARFVAFGTYPSARKGDTFFNNVRTLPAASNALVTQGGWSWSHYYRLETDRQHPADESKAVDEFRGLLFDSVRLRLQADVPVGSCLSGGLDSSAIVAAIHHIRSGIGHGGPLSSQMTFSSVFEEVARYNERPFIDAVLEKIPANGVLVFPSTKDLDEHIGDVVRCQDEPFGDLSIFAQWCVMRAAKEHDVGVLLDGQGADEALGGYSPFAVHIAELLGRGHVLRAAQELKALPADTGPGRARTATSVLLRQLPARLQSALGRGRPRNEDALSMLVPELREDPGMLVDDGFAEDQRSLSQLLRHQIEERVLPTLLRYEDRNSSAFGLEARVPFLDHRLVEFAFRRVPHLRIKHGWTKWVLRSAVADLLPDVITWRRAKVGFSVPGGRWLTHLAHEDPDLLGPSSPAGEFINLQQTRTILDGTPDDTPTTALMWRCANVDKWLLGLSHGQH